MLTISTQAYINSTQPYLFLNGVPEGFYEIIVVLHKKESAPKKPVKAGFSKATFEMSADFNQPLEDFKEYME